MHTINDRDGNPISRSRNMRGIRARVGKHLVKTVAISPLKGEDEGKLMILFDDGASYETNFASYATLVDCVRRWRNLYGAELLINGESCGPLSFDNLRISVEGDRIRYGS